MEKQVVFVAIFIMMTNLFSLFYLCCHGGRCPMDVVVVACGMFAAKT